MKKVLSRPWALATLVLSVAFTAVTACVHVLSFHAPALDEPEITIVILVLVVTVFLLWIPAVSVVVERAKAAGLTSGVQDFTGLLFRSTPPSVRRIVMAVAAYAFLVSVLDAGIFALHLNPAIPLSAVFLAFSSIASGILWGVAWEPKRAA